MENEVAEKVKTVLPDIYSGDLNRERIKTYGDIHESWNLELGTVREIFNAGADWYRKKVEEANL